MLFHLDSKDPILPLVYTLLYNTIVSCIFLIGFYFMNDYVYHVNNIVIPIHVTTLSFISILMIAMEYPTGDHITLLFAIMLLSATMLSCFVVCTFRYFDRSSDELFYDMSDDESIDLCDEV